MSDEQKVVRNGKVAILVSRSFGAGWSTWASDREIAKKMMFCPALVEAVEAGADRNQLLAVAEEHFPEAYYGGVEDLAVEWLPEGTAFYIDEYDGSESLRTGDDLTEVA